MSKATPRPWTLSSDVEHSCCYRSAIRNEKDDLIAEADKADAELIVRAVNCHDELISALEFLLTEFKDGDISTEDYYEAKNKCVDLLKRARGEK
jgi:hypothetical protein